MLFLSKVIYNGRYEYSDHNIPTIEYTEHPEYSDYCIHIHNQSLRYARRKRLYVIPLFRDPLKTLKP